MSDTLVTTRGGLAVGLFVLVMASGCSTTPDVDDEQVTEEPAAEAEGPEADQLADNPCGNPDWDQPPPEVTSLSDSDSETD